MRRPLIPVYSPQRGWECPWRDLINACLILPYYFIVAPGAIINRISLSHFTISSHLYTWTLLICMCSFSSPLSAALLVLSSTLQESPTGRMRYPLTCNPFTSNYFPICRYSNARLKINEHCRQRSPSISWGSLGTASCFTIQEGAAQILPSKHDTKFERIVHKWLLMNTISSGVRNQDWVNLIRGIFYQLWKKIIITDLTVIPWTLGSILQYLCPTMATQTA